DPKRRPAATGTSRKIPRNKCDSSLFFTVPANRGQTGGAAAARRDAPIAGERYAQPFPAPSDRRSVQRRDNYSVRLQQRRLVVRGPIGRRREWRCSGDNG